jgi:hypothetical protein
VEPWERISMARTKEDQRGRLTKLVNASGFLFQLGVEHQIRASSDVHKCEVLVKEHPWSLEGADVQGFIDLVVEKGAVRLVIECKRSRNAEWVFLVPEGSPNERTEFRCLWAQRRVDNTIRTGWDDLQVLPKSSEAGFCVVRGTGEGEKSLLERICGPLLDSVDSLASQEIKLSERRFLPVLMIYFPVIVTTATLYTCNFKAENISVASGQIPPGEFQAVPLVRFRKSMTTQVDDDPESFKIESLNSASQRSVLVVNANSLCEVLKALDVPSSRVWKSPWNKP